MTDTRDSAEYTSAREPRHRRQDPRTAGRTILGLGEAALQAVAALLAAGLGIAINIATGSEARWWSWAAVVALALLGALVAFAGVRASRPEPEREPRPARTVYQNQIGSFSGRLHQGNVYNGHPWWWTVAITMAVAWLVVASALTVSGLTSTSGPSIVIPPARAVGEAPLVSARVLRAPCQGGWVTDKSEAQIAADPLSHDIMSKNLDSWTNWPLVVGGAKAATEKVQLNVQGANGTQVTINDIRIRKVRDLPAMKGLTLSAGCGGDSAFRYLTADLDQTPPRVQAEEEGDASAAAGSGFPPEETKPMRFPYTVSMSDAENFEIQANANQRDVSWVIDLSWASAGKSGTMTLDDGGQPFRTTGTVNTRQCSVYGPTFECD